MIETRHFRVEACRGCPLPGYFIVSSREEAEFLDQLTPCALSELGEVLAEVTRAVRIVTKADRVYCGQFAEQTRSVHFHVFPRTATMADQFIIENPDVTLIDGPRLLSWAQQRLRGEMNSKETEAVNSAVFSIITSTLIES